MSDDTLTITDNRTGKTYNVRIVYGTYPTYGAAIPAADLRQIRVSPDDFGLMTYDPGLVDTASTRSRITFVDGERGILRYRGYPIEQLAAQSTYQDPEQKIVRPRQIYDGRDVRDYAPLGRRDVARAA